MVHSRWLHSMQHVAHNGSGVPYKLATGMVGTIIAVISSINKNICHLDVTLTDGKQRARTHNTHRAPISTYQSLTFFLCVYAGCLQQWMATRQPETGEVLVAFLLLHIPRIYSSVLASDFSVQPPCMESPTRVMLCTLDPLLSCQI